LIFELQSKFIENKYNITINTWDQLAHVYQDKFMDLTIYNHSYDRFCELIDHIDNSVLEIGCGPGNITKYLLNKRPELKITATDVSPNMIALAKQNVLAAEYLVIDAREIEKLNRTFNGIMCGFCIPYLAREDVNKMIKDCYNLLTAKGILYISAIEGHYDQSKFEYGSVPDLKTFVHYYSEQDLSDYLLKMGFKIAENFRIPYLKKDGSQETHLILIALKP
jgi:ubiquinone/menaquinone biosynthesis C-methylase UbiE